MLYDGAAATYGKLSVTALPADRVEAEIQPVLAGLPPSSPYELPSVHESIIVHKCTNTKNLR